MTNYNFEKTTPAETQSMQQDYLQQTTAPLDGMWLVFTGMAEHYLIREGDQTIGYCAVNTEHQLLQFYTVPNANADQIFAQALANLSLKGAVISTVEPASLSLCLDHQKSVAVNALMYQEPTNQKAVAAIFPEASVFKPVSVEELETAVNFAHEALGADRGWLTSYYSERIAGGELFGLWQSGKMIAAGECRPSVIQPKYADVGMVVSPDHRAKGIATNILRELLKISHNKGLKPICSTECSNVGAQKSITRAGFISHQRILEITF